MEPEWRRIKRGYRVSDDGRVQSCIKPGSKTKEIGTEWRDLTPTPQRSGHLLIWLGRKDCRYVHALVLNAFVGPCPDGMEACHFPDRDPSNNRVDNLRWGTRQENHADSVEHGTAFFVHGANLGEDHPSVKLDECLVRKIMFIRMRFGFGAPRICRILKLDSGMRGAVDGIIRGQSWNHVTGLPPYRPQSSTPGPRRKDVSETLSQRNAS